MYGREYQQKLNTLTDNSFKEKIDNMIRHITILLMKKQKILMNTQIVYNR